MTKTLTLFILTFSSCCLGQTRKFSFKEFDRWMMNYYKQPERGDLFNAFEFGIHNKKIAKAGNRTMVIGFFSSALRNDTLMQQAFYQQLKQTDDDNFIYGFGYTLWLIHTDHSIKLLDEFLKPDRMEVYQGEFKKLNKQKFTDLWSDRITSPEHLDLLWADFFATGNERSIKKIISNLSELDSKDPYELATAGSAQWSLTSNAISHDKVLQICKAEQQSADQEFRAPLNEIVTRAENERAKKKGK
jgi:hypothetical protein